METLVIVASKDKTNQMLAEKLNGDITESFAKDDIELQVGKWTEEQYAQQAASLS